MQKKIKTRHKGESQATEVIQLSDCTATVVKECFEPGIKDGRGHVKIVGDGTEGHFRLEVPF